MSPPSPAGRPFDIASCSGKIGPRAGQYGGAASRGPFMPHVICEYSANVEDKIRLDALLETLHAAVMRTRISELAGLRTRRERRANYGIADNDPANGFVNITVRIAKGRSAETRRLVAETVFAAAQTHLEGVFATTP